MRAALHILITACVCGFSGCMMQRELPGPVTLPHSPAGPDTLGYQQPTPPPAPTPVVAAGYENLPQRAEEIHRAQQDPGKLFTSRWAMADPDYRQKYGGEYRKSKKIPRMAKQVIDARHVSGKSGMGLGVKVSDRPFASGVDLSGFHYPQSWSEVHGSLTGAIQEGEEDLMVGLSGGIRIQPPTRAAPFVGVGGFAGVGFLHEVANSLSDEEDRETVALGAVYPEAGVHFWLTPRMRLTGSAGYRVTTSGRDYDHWFYGLSVSWLDLRDDGSKPMTRQETQEWLENYASEPQRLPATSMPAPPSPPGPPPAPTPVR